MGHGSWPRRHCGTGATQTHEALEDDSTPFPKYSARIGAAANENFASRQGMGPLFLFSSNEILLTEVPAAETRLTVYRRAEVMNHGSPDFPGGDVNA